MAFLLNSARSFQKRRLKNEHKTTIATHSPRELSMFHRRIREAIPKSSHRRCKVNTKLQAQLKRFIRGGFKYSQFTNAIYDFLYLDTNVFIAHFNKRCFYYARFETDADKTINLLALVRKPELRPMCLELAHAMIIKLRIDTVTTQIRTVSVPTCDLPTCDLPTCKSPWCAH
jgi:hypothetical protein